jgi:pyridoxal phosphate enzyme (YggS family)
MAVSIAAAMSEASPEERLADVRARIAKAAALARRQADGVTLIAVSKTRDPEAIAPLLRGGQRAFGENRVQEAQGKWPALKEQWPDVRLHLIGQLQSNKAEEAVALFDAIHSVDRPSLVAALGKAMEKVGRRPDCFLQVNVGEEAQKGGCTPAELPALITAAEEAGLPVAGLMCIPPADVEPAPYFALLAKLSRRHGLSGLSMGMSSDYETAVTIGASHVRVGTALFGARD